MLEGRCKLCKIGIADKSTLIKIHNLRFKDDIPLRMMEDKIKEIIETHENEEIRVMPPPSYVAVQSHFDKHTSPRLKAKYKTQCAMPDILRDTRKELEDIPEVRVELQKIEKEKFNLYQDLSSLYVVLKERFEQFDEAQGKKIDLGFPGEKGNLEGYSVMSTHLRACLVELNKMRQAEQLAKNIVHYTLTQYTKLVIEEIMKELEGLRRVLSSHIKDGLIVDDIIDGVQNNFGVYLSKGANEILKKTEDQFNLN